MFRKTDLLKDHSRDRFHVTLKDGTSFSGILLQAAKTNLEFADVRVSDNKAEGWLFVDRDNIEYMQLVNNAADIR